LQTVTRAALVEPDFAILKNNVANGLTQTLRAQKDDDVVKLPGGGVVRHGLFACGGSVNAAVAPARHKKLWRAVPVGHCELGLSMHPA
jgi:hypothetical protein